MERAQKECAKELLKSPKKHGRKGKGKGKGKGNVQRTVNGPAHTLPAESGDGSKIVKSVTTMVDSLLNLLTGYLPERVHKDVWATAEASATNYVAQKLRKWYKATDCISYTVKDTKKNRTM